MERADIAIIGTGPGGVSAALTAKVRNKNILLIGKKQMSDKVSKAHQIMNYPGLPAVTGADMAKAFEKQLAMMEINITDSRIGTVYAMGDYFAIQAGGEVLEAKSVILACGVVSGKTLPGEEEMLGRGVSYCATCDACFYKGKKVLVTGHTGFKGTWLSRILVNAGAEVTGYSLNPPTDPALFNMAGLEGKMNSVIGDIRDLAHLKQVFEDTKPEIVLHLAAQPIVRDSYKDPVYTYETNVIGTVNILECVRLNPCVKSFLNVTTDKVYENREWEYGYREVDRLDGYDPYSNSKSCSELVTHSYRKSFFADGHCAISTCRAGNVIGGGDFANDRIVPDCVRAAMAKKPIVVRNPHSTRPYQHVLEPLAAYLMVAKAQYEDGKYAGYYNVGPDDKDCVTTGELVDMFCNAWGNGLSWENKSDGGPHEANFLKLDCSKLKTTFGWHPRYGVKEAIGLTVEWCQEYEKNGDVVAVMDRQIKEMFQ